MMTGPGARAERNERALRESADGLLTMSRCIVRLVMMGKGYGLSLNPSGNIQQPLTITAKENSRPSSDSGRRKLKMAWARRPSAWRRALSDKTRSEK